MQFDVTPVFEKNYAAWPDYRVHVNQGGTRSSKTYSLAQMFIVKLMEHTGKVLTICRKTMPSLKGTVMRDFFEILHKHDLYNGKDHNKTESTYMLNGNLVEFVAIDDPQKVRGRKRNWLWANEGNELRHEDWKQLIFRTTEKVFLDFNPSDEYHWIYDHVLTRKDCNFIKSTFLDNPFLPKELVEEILRLKDEDENYWRVYGLGEKGSSGATIYTNWELYDEEFTKEKKLKQWLFENVDDWCFGLDFGFNVPSSLIFCGFHEKTCYVREFLYEKGLTNDDLIEKLKSIDKEFPDLKLREKEIFADAAEPKSIEELYRAGFNCKKSNKDVKHGLKTVKSHKLLVHRDSINMQKEIKFYKFKEDRDGNVLDEPVKFNDHAMDAMRYGMHSYVHERMDIEDCDVDWA